MANAKYIMIKESLQELRKQLKKAPEHLSPRLKMLIEIKDSPIALSKNELAKRVGVNPNSIQTWRTHYSQGGIRELLKDGRIGFKPAILSKAMHEKVAVQLQSPQPAFSSYKQLHNWVNGQLKKKIKYNSLRHYVKRHFGAKLKVARKSHIRKDKEAVEAFKKTLSVPVKSK